MYIKTDIKKKKRHVIKNETPLTAKRVNSKNKRMVIHLFGIFLLFHP